MSQPTYHRRVGTSSGSVWCGPEILPEVLKDAELGADCHPVVLDRRFEEGYRGPRGPPHQGGPAARRPAVRAHSRRVRLASSALDGAQALELARWVRGGGAMAARKGVLNSV